MLYVFAGTIKGRNLFLNASGPIGFPGGFSVPAAWTWNSWRGAFFIQMTGEMVQV